jgi:hypothetical protein
MYNHEFYELEEKIQNWEVHSEEAIRRQQYLMGQINQISGRIKNLIDIKLIEHGNNHNNTQRQS